MKGVRGMSLIDVLVGTSIFLIVFLSIFAAYKLSIELVLNTKAKTGALSLVSQQMEYVRGLPYDSIGTVGGIPAGAIPQDQVQVLNNVSYRTHTLVQYFDDPADGSGNSDTNGITADYKEVKVEVFWTLRQQQFSVFSVTRMSPHSIETLANGGTLRINVFDATAAPIEDAVVRIQNASTTPTIDVTVNSDSTGTVSFPGAPAASNYMITVTKSGYSSAQTYAVTGQNPNPNPGSVTVVNKKTTSASFAIDRVGVLTVSTFSPVTTGFFDDPFANQNNLFATTSTTVSGAALKLTTSGPGGAYASTGDATSIAISPALLVSWDTLTWTGTTPANTTRAVQLYYLSAGNYVLVPDAVLAGNSAGLTSGSVSLSALATSTYPTLRLKALLTSSAASSTPTMTDWKINYHAGPTPLPNIAFTIHGAKTIGTTSGGAPIYKMNETDTTTSFATWVISPIEWDSYTITPSGSVYDISEQCPTPLSVQPGQNQSVALQLMSHTANTLRVVATANGVSVPNATIAIVGSTNATTTSSYCGQGFFSGLAVGTYKLTVTAAGYQVNTQNVSVSGQSVSTVVLNP